MQPVAVVHCRLSLASRLKLSLRTYFTTGVGGKKKKKTFSPGGYVATVYIPRCCPSPKLHEHLFHVDHMRKRTILKERAVRDYCQPRRLQHKCWSQQLIAAMAAPQRQAVVNDLNASIILAANPEAEVEHESIGSTCGRPHRGTCQHNSAATLPRPSCQPSERTRRHVHRLEKNLTQREYSETPKRVFQKISDRCQGFSDIPVNFGKLRRIWKECGRLRQKCIHPGFCGSFRSSCAACGFGAAWVKHAMGFLLHLQVFAALASHLARCNGYFMDALAKPNDKPKSVVPAKTKRRSRANTIALSPRHVRNGESSMNKSASYDHTTNHHSYPQFPGSEHKSKHPELLRAPRCRLFVRARSAPCLLRSLCVAACAWLPVSSGGRPPSAATSWRNGCRRAATRVQRPPACKSSLRCAFPQPPPCAELAAAKLALPALGLPWIALDYCAWLWSWSWPVHGARAKRLQKGPTKEKKNILDKKRHATLTRPKSSRKDHFESPLRLAKSMPTTGKARMVERERKIKRDDLKTVRLLRSLRTFFCARTLPFAGTLLAPRCCQRRASYPRGPTTVGRAGGCLAHFGCHVRASMPVQLCKKTWRSAACTSPGWGESAYVGIGAF